VCDIHVCVHDSECEHRLAQGERAYIFIHTHSLEYKDWCVYASDTHIRAYIYVRTHIGMNVYIRASSKVILTYVHIYVYIYTRVNIYVSALTTATHIYMQNICIHTHMHEYKHRSVYEYCLANAEPEAAARYAHTHTHTQTYMYLKYTYTSAYIYIHTYICVSALANGANSALPMWSKTQKLLRDIYTHTHIYNTFTYNTHVPRIYLYAHTQVRLQ